MEYVLKNSWLFIFTVFSVWTFHKILIMMRNWFRLCMIFLKMKSNPLAVWEKYNNFSWFFIWYIIFEIKISWHNILIFQVWLQDGTQRNSQERLTKVFVRLLVLVLGILAESNILWLELVKKATIIVLRSTRRFTISVMDSTWRMAR